MKMSYCPIVLLAATLLGAPADSPNGNWRYYGGDQGNSHYSPLTQINKTNLNQLRRAWEWKAGEEPIPKFGAMPSSFEASPLMVDDVLYVPTPYNRLVAINATTGKEIWNYDPHSYELGPGVRSRPWARQRGVGFWTDGKRRRIFLPTRDRMMALDADTGKLIPGFGKEGIIDLTEHLMWKVTDRTHFNMTSPPVIYKNLIIVGSSIPDRLVQPQSPPGDVQAFDAITGKLMWTFHTIPQAGEFGNDTWEDDAWKTSGHNNVWTPITLDEKRGLLYLPVSSPANDYFGGWRKGNTLFASSLVCIDAITGKRVWHFQAVHHDLWDYDGVMGATLITIHVNGKAVDAVAAVSKMGFTFVFDRVTGKPVWPIEERPVPQSDVPGEKTSPTQPFPTKPPSFAKQGFTPDDVVDFTPEIKAMALEKIKGYKFGPVFNPPSFQGTLLMPKNGGGANWGGASVDPTKGLLYVRSGNILHVIKISKRITEKDAPGPDDPDFPEAFALTVAGGIYVNKPPYSTITAIDLNKGDILWQVPAGDLASMHNNPALKGVTIPPTGVPGYGGVLVTATGLLFNGPGDNRFYALDQDTGKTLWTGDLDEPASGTAMTYRTRAGKQFVIVPTGMTKNATLVAFALPE